MRHHTSVQSEVEPVDQASAEGGPPGGDQGEGATTAGRNKHAGISALPDVEEWIVCGLVQSDRFATDSQAIPSTAVLWFAFALIAVFCLSPLITLRLLRAKERLCARDGVLLTISTFLGAALFTLAVSDVCYYNFRLRTEADDELRRVARSMQDNLSREENAIWQQLDEFDRPSNGSWLADDLNAIRNRTSLTARSAADGGATRSCHPQDIEGDTPYVCMRTDILGTQARAYPYLNFVFWDDNQGRQRVKWTYQRQVTSFLAESHMPYFSGMRTEASWLEKKYDRAKNGGTIPRARGIDSVYSVNSGKNIALYWRLEEPNLNNTLSGRGSPSNASRLWSATLVTRPVSLIGAVLPTDVRFAVVNKDGLVLFHSDPAKNRIEDFFAECDDNAKLRSLVSERASRFLYAYYAGRRQRFYVCPLQHEVDGALVPDTGPGALKGDSLWSLVVFEDMVPAETMNLEALTSSSIVFLFYAGILVVAWTLIHARWRRYPGKWFWPVERKAAAYRLVALLNGFISALLWVLIRRAPPGTVLLAGFLIPAMALALTFLAINYEGGGRDGGETPGVGTEDRSAAGREARSSGSIARAWQRLLALLSCTGLPGWEASYSWARVSLLLVVGVLPCFAFFRVSFEFEKMLLTDRRQHRLIRSLGERQERVRSDYQSIALAEENQDQLIPDPSRNSAAVKAPLWLALGRPDEPAGDESMAADAGDAPQPGDASEGCFGDGLQRLLAAVRPHYNDVARETESLVSDQAGAQHGRCSSASYHRPPPVAQTGHPHDWDGPVPSPSQWAPSSLGFGDWGGCLGLALFVGVLFWLVRAGDEVFLLGLYRAIPVPGDPEFSHAVGEFKRKVAAANETASREIAAFFRDECSATPELRAIGKELVSQMRDEAEVTQEDVVLRVRELADGYYRSLWETLSPDQELVLAQLAQEGLVNPKSREVVAQLMNKGLIVRDRSFQLMNQSFARFVVSALPPHTLVEWEAEGVRLPWRSLRNLILVTVVGLAIFLYITQQSLFENVTASVAAIAAGVPALIKIAGIFQRAPAGSPRPN